VQSTLTAATDPVAFPSAAAATAASFHLPAGKDRYGDDGARIWGLIPLNIKIATTDSQGGLMLFEHRKMSKGGPPRHVHFEQDEWFYVIEGEFAFEIGEAKYRVTVGGSVFAPRKVPHAWACVSDTPGTILTMVSPAGTFEAFIRETATFDRLPSPEEVAAAFERHNMKVLGPPLHA
jgi:mannose-6-phosphate isomerase-like protein (cupin superfamily)